MTTAVETLAFQAEIKQLLDLMIQSLYTNRNIFLRELISNASDALDLLRFQSLTNPELLAADNRFEIRIEIDRQHRTLTLEDSGIGMTRPELVANIGTIAKSGTRAARQKALDGGSVAGIQELIGQFGVGFYSAFMVAEKVLLSTRHATENTATAWESSGDGTYSIWETEKARRGTSITLHLKQPDAETGIEDYTDEWRIRSIVKQYSDFINYPIVLKSEREEMEQDEHGMPKSGGKTTINVEDVVLNSMKPVWTRRPADVSQEDYFEFYRHLAHDGEAPLKTIHFEAEGMYQYQALLYIPAKASSDLYYVAPDFGLRLCAKRVMIMEKCPDLLPRYLRFVRGLIDAADLPLNISRQRLQQDHHIGLIRKRLARKILEALKGLSETDKQRYVAFWRQFGRCIKEGIGSDYENTDRLVPLLLFESSNDPETVTTLADYVARMKEGQQQIFYLTGESRIVVENSPQLERIREKGYEVLYLTDSVDELMLQYLHEWEGRKLKSVGKGVVDLSSTEEKANEQRYLEEHSTRLKGLLDLFQTKLTENVKQVRVTNRLKSSPVCLVVEEHDYSPVLERALQRGTRTGQRRVLEINPSHPLIERMWQRFVANSGDESLADMIQVMFGVAMLAEGSPVPDALRFNQTTYRVLECVLRD